MTSPMKHVNPESVPSMMLPTGSRIPCMGLGTFGSDTVPAATVGETVRQALCAGYRHIDCAAVYGNEHDIGDILRQMFAGGFLKREEVWITSKVWNDMHDRVGESCRRSLADLRLDYLDLYLVHWPFPNFHPPGCDVTSRSPDAKPYLHDRFMHTWRQMEELLEEGLVRNIGTSNMTIPKLQLLLRDASVLPSCNEMEVHPHFQQPELVAFCRSHRIQPIAYCPLGSPGRPERDRTPDDTVDLADDVILAIAERRKITPAQVALKWSIQRGLIPIPFSVNHFRENLQAAADPPLTPGDMEAIARIDKNCRLIKGQVFLWKDNQSWQDLWDPDGVIAR